MSLLEQILVLGLGCAVAVPTMNAFKDAKNEALNQAERMGALVEQASELSKNLPVCLPSQANQQGFDSACNQAKESHPQPAQAQVGPPPSVRAYSSKKFN